MAVWLWPMRAAMNPVTSFGRSDLTAACPSNSMGYFWSRFIPQRSRIFDNRKVGRNFKRNFALEDQEVTLSVFPAHAGMNR
jgi:hypothetical protein